MRFPATHWGDWVGTYVGSATVEIYEADTTYSDVPVCIEVWLGEGQVKRWPDTEFVLANIYFSAVPAPRDLEGISDGYYVGSESECAGVKGSLVLEGFSSINGVTSPDTLSMSGPRVDNSWTAPKRQQFQVIRSGEELSWGVWISRRKTHPQFGTYHREEIAELHLSVIDVGNPAAFRIGAKGVSWPSLLRRR